MKPSNLWIILGLAAVVTTSVVFFRASKNLALKADPLAEKFEFWSIEFDGQFHHGKCGGDFKSTYKLYALVNGSLAKLMALPPTEAKMKVEAEASYVGQEEVLKPSPSKTDQLMPSPISPTSAHLTAFWFRESSDAHLEIEIESEGALMNGYCSEKGRIYPHPIKKLRLSGNVAEPQAITGSWTAVDHENSGYTTQVVGTFKLQWLGGGASKRPIPGPQDIKPTIRLDRTVLLQWTATPGAEKYMVYFGKNPKLKPDPKVQHVDTDKPFVALDVKGNFPFYVIATSFIGGVETGPSEVIQVAPQMPQAQK